LRCATRLMRGLLLKPTLNLLSWILRGRGNSLIGGGPLGWNWYATLAAMATDHHGDMTSFGGTHHSHTQLGGVTADQHHAQDHAARHGSGQPDAVSLAASQIGTGTFPVARGGTGLSTIAAGGILYASALDTLSRIAPTAANQVLRSTAANALQIAALVAADIPYLDASKITAGRFGMARMPDYASGYVLTSQGYGNNPAYASAIPSGLIAMWSGLIANIPSGWLICDGNNSTPNLLNRFVKQVPNTSTNPGATGGLSTVTLTVSEMPAHSHLARYPAGGTFIGGYQITEKPRTDGPANLSSDTIENTGGGSAHENKPPYYEIAFIMKI